MLPDVKNQGVIYASSYLRWHVVNDCLVSSFEHDFRRLEARHALTDIHTVAFNLVRSKQYILSFIKILSFS
jgi:hypothetical protein